MEIQSNTQGRDISLYSAKVVLCTIYKCMYQNLSVLLDLLFYFWREGERGGCGWFCSIYLQTSGCHRGLKSGKCSKQISRGFTLYKTRVGLTCTKPTALTAPRKNMITQLTLRSVIYFHAKSNFLRQCVIDVKMTAFKTVLRVTRSIMPEF